MNNLSIETLHLALFTALAAAPGFATKSRRLKHWNDVSATQQPAMFQAQEDFTVATDSGFPSKYSFNVKLYVYARVEGAADPGPVLNPLVDAIVNIVNARNPITGRNALQLNDVAYCRVEGTVQIDEGTLDNQAVAVIPVVIYAT